jgi:hypothetical protein
MQENPHLGESEMRLQEELHSLLEQEDTRWNSEQRSPG